jgi:hypothetical protein
LVEFGLKSSAQAPQSSGERQAASTVGHNILKKLPEGEVRRVQGNASNKQLFPCAQAVLRTTHVAAEICERSAATHDDTNLWFSMLDHFVTLKENLRTELPHHRSMLESAVTELMQFVLDKMSKFVSLPLIVRKVFDQHSSTNLSELRDVLLSMLDT